MGGPLARREPTAAALRRQREALAANIRFGDFVKTNGKFPGYKLVERVYDQKTDSALTGPPLRRSPFLEGIFQDIVPESEHDKVLVHTYMLDLRGEDDFFFGPDCWSWHTLRSTDTNNIEEVTKVTLEEVLAYYKSKIDAFDERIKKAREEPETVYQRLGSFDEVVPFNFSEEPEKRRYELSLVTCIDARKKFRLEEIYGILESAETPLDRFKIIKMKARPGTNRYIIIPTSQNSQITPPVAVQIVNQQGSLDLDEAEVGREVAVRMPELFGKERGGNPSMYIAFEVPKEVLDLAQKVYVIRRPEIEQATIIDI